VCDEIDKVFNLDLEVRQPLKALHKGVESLKSDTTLYKVLLSAMEKVTDLDESSPHTRFAQLYVMWLHSSSHAHRANNLQSHRLGAMEAMENLVRALQATRSPLENKPSDPTHEATMNSPGNKNLETLLTLHSVSSRPTFGRNIVTSLLAGSRMRPPRFSCANRATKAPPNMYGTFMWFLGRGLVTLPLSRTSPIFRTTSGRPGWMTASADTMRRFETLVPCKPRCL